MKDIVAFIRRCRAEAAARRARGDYDDVSVKGPGIGFDELVPERRTTLRVRGWLPLAEDDPGPLHTALQHNNKHDPKLCRACATTRTLPDGTRQELR